IVRWGVVAPSAPGSRFVSLDGPLTATSGSTARTAGSLRRLAASAAEIVVATAFTVLYVTRRGAWSCLSWATIGLRSAWYACARRAAAPGPAGAVCWFRSRTMPRWSAFADSPLAWAAVRRLVHPKVFSDMPALPTPASPAATANAMSPTTPPARSALASLFFIWKVPLLRTSPPPNPDGSRSMTRCGLAPAEGSRKASYRDPILQSTLQRSGAPSERAEERWNCEADADGVDHVEPDESEGVRQRDQA